MSASTGAHQTIARQSSAVPDGMQPFTMALDNNGKVWIRPNLSRGLDWYVTQSAARGEAVVQAGAAEGVATFTRPLREEDLVELSAAGLEILSVEAIGRDPSGIASVGTSFGSDLDNRLSDIGGPRQISVEGVVSADIIVRSAASYRRLSEDPRVLLVDLAREEVLRSRGTTDSVLLNDLYWTFAGLLPAN